MTVTERAGFHRYTFPESGEKNLIINLGFAINWDKPYKTELTVVDKNSVTGTRLSTAWAKDQHVYFAVRFSVPFTSDDTDQKKIFYTSLYHIIVAPALFSDINGQFKGLNGDVQTAGG
jgi:putative alpha-1,2-mannosidase